MIICTRCGNANPENRRDCQFCGASLVQTAYQGDSRSSFPQGTPMQAAPSAQAPQSPELPAWLESLRSDMPGRSPDPSSASFGGSNFSAADFMEEGDLPHWMQPSGEPDEDDARSQSASRPLRSSAFSAPNTDEGYTHNISAHDLIDKEFLPPWMREESNASSSSFEGQHNISASSLVQPDGVPAWMKDFPQSQPEPLGSQGQQAALWQDDGAFSTYQSPASSQQGQPAPQGFSARDLIDPQSLPQWMQEQNVPGTMRNMGRSEGSSPSWNMPGQGQPGAGTHRSGEQAMPTGGFSASSLLDMNALPAWMRESEQQSASAPQQQAAWQPPAQSAFGVQGTQGSQMQQVPPSQQGGLAAASFIDVNALPEWLRAASEQGQAASWNQAGNGANAGAAAGMGPRPDNVRVPSRPRGELGMNEGNEAAANAFASMLGVASHSPQLSQGPAYSLQAMASPPSVPQQYAGYQGGGSSPSMPPAQGQAPYMNSIGVSQGPQMGTQAGSYNGQQARQGAGQYPVSPNQPQSSSQEKPQKRGGLFEAIRNFFFRQS